MAEIASIIAVIVALGALWLASHANSHADASFEKVGKLLAKQVRDAQVTFNEKATQVQNELQKIERDINLIRTHNSDTAEKLNTLTLRIKVVEHDLKNMTEAIPPQFLQRKPAKRSDGSI